MKQIKYFLLIVFAFLIQHGFCQTDDKINQDVEVVKAYTPTISDAFKINELPAIKDSFKVEPVFNYSIESKQIPVDFQVEPIKSAKMLDEPLSRLYNSYIKLGFGNYVTPFAELYISNLRSKKFNYSAIFRHLSSLGNITNDAEKKVFSGYSDNMISLSGKKFLTKKSLYGTLDYRDNSINYYGYNTADTSIKNPPVDKGDQKKQQFQLFSFNGGIKSAFTDKSHLNYDVWMHYYYFQDNFKNNENFTSVNALLSKYYNKELLGADIKTDFIKKNFNDTLNAVIKINPWISRVTERWEVRIGLSIFTDIFWKEKYHFYPDVYLQYAVLANYIVPYFGLQGYIEENTYKKTAYENLFVRPGLDFRNTNHSKVIYGGIKGSISSNTFYNVKATFSDLTNAYFFVNDTSLNSAGQRLQNQFVFAVSDATLLHLNSELSIKASEKLSFHLKGNYYYYDNMDEKKAWHIPQFDAMISGNYNLRNKFILSADIFVIGDRSAKNYDFTSTVNGARLLVEKNLPLVVDANLGFEYRYNKSFSGFIHLNNIANQKFYRWNNYQMQGFNMLAGITYSF